MQVAAGGDVGLSDLQKLGLRPRGYGEGIGHAVWRARRLMGGPLGGILAAAAHMPLAGRPRAPRGRAAPQHALELCSPLCPPPLSTCDNLPPQLAHSRARYMNMGTDGSHQACAARHHVEGGMRRQGTAAAAVARGLGVAAATSGRGVCQINGYSSDGKGTVERAEPHICGCW